MANKTLTASVKLNTSSAEKSIDRLCKKLNQINKAVNSSANASTKMGNEINKACKKSGTAIDGLTKKVHRLANAYLGVMGGKALITTSDTITKAENKFNYLNGGDMKATQATMDKMYASSQKVRMGYTDMMANVSKSMTLASGSFQDNVDNAIRFQEIMAEAYTLGGASAQEMHSSMYQMIQALGSGILAGDELRSVREGAPLAYKEIEKFAQGIYGADQNLKDLASQGKITSDIVVAAIMGMGDKADRAFKQTSMTFEQAWTKIKNDAVKSFEPVLQMLNKALGSSTGQAIINGIGRALQIVAFLLESIFNFIADNWSWLQPVIIAIGSAIAMYLTYRLVILTWTILKTVATAIVGIAITNSTLFVVIGTIAFLIGLVAYMADSFRDACGIIMGAVFIAGAFIWNVVVGVLNAIIQFAWTCFVEPWIGIVEWILNVCNGGFNSFGDGVRNLLGNIISWFLSLGKVVTKIIDAIFGTDWTSGLNSLQDSVLAWGKSEKAITLDREPAKLNRISYGSAYNKGYDFGVGQYDKLANKLGGLLPSLPTDITTGGLSTSNPSGLLDDIGKNIGDTANNTGKIADAMDLTEEDLSYLRKVAEMEWKKEFTTASIVVDMTNNNSISGEGDLDGIVTKLRDKLYEELDSVANGVYV